MADGIQRQDMPMKFTVGYYDLHEDRSLNFQMNRWITYLGESGLEDIRAIAPKIKSYADWTREFTALGRKSLSEGKPVHAAYYFRSAEFFTFPGDPDKQELRESFLKLIREGYAMDRVQRHLIPYVNGFENGFLPAYRLTPENPKCVIVLFGGFDSYIEEFFPIMLSISGQGFDIVCFEGPGQGSALEDYGMHMTHEWEKPVKAVLDYFGLEDVTLIGISLGGYLGLRAAAFEPRVKRVIACDVLYDFFAVNMSNVSGAAMKFLNVALNVGATGLVNLVVARKARISPIIDWGLQQGMHVTGTSTPFDYLKTIKKYTTADISRLVRQDVLLMAGSEDHYIPLDQFYSQVRALTGTRSLTARLFTRSEQAQGHCQFSNLGLAIDVMLTWIELERRNTH